MISHPIKNRAFLALVTVCFILSATVVLADDPPASSKDLLEQAAAQINAHDYVAAKQTLEQVKPAELTPADQKRLSYLITRADYGVDKAAKLRQSLEQADQFADRNDFISARQTLEKALQSAQNDPTAEKSINAKLAAIKALEKNFHKNMKDLFYKSVKNYDAGRLDQAEHGFKTVISSSVDLGFWNRGKPQKYIQKIANKKAKLAPAFVTQPESKPVTAIVVKPIDTTAAPEPEPAVATAVAQPTGIFSQRNQAVVQQELLLARTAWESRNFDKVLLHTKNVLALSPDNAEAQELQDEALRYVTSATAPGQTLIDEEVRQRRILTQRISMQHQLAMDRADALVVEQKFTEARSVVSDAQAILTARQSILPADQAAQMRTVGQSKFAHIDQQERAYQIARAEDEQSRAKAAAEQAVSIAQQQRNARVQELFSQGATFIQERKYSLALDRYRQVLTIDPNNKSARSLASWLQDQMYYVGNQDVYREADDERYRSMQETDKASIPFDRDPPVTWDENWVELSRRRLRHKSGIVADSPENADARMRMSARHPRFEYEDTPLSEVFDDLREKSGLNIMPNWSSLSDSGIEKTQGISLMLRNVSIERVLKAVLDGLSAGFYSATISYSLQDGVVVIASEADLARDYYAVVYDISDLLLEVSDRRGGTGFDPGGGQGGNRSGGSSSSGGSSNRGSSSRRSSSSGGDDTQGQRDELEEGIVELIRGVAPEDTWAEGTGQGTVTVYGTRLIVTQSAENHTKILEMLNQIRETRPVQISVESRFVFVTDNFLEDIGVDLDFFLNPTGRWVGPDWRPQTLAGFPGFRFGLPAPLVGTQGGASWSGPASTGLPGSLGGAAGPTAITIAGSFLDKLEVDFFLRATQADQQSTTLTAPRITFENGGGGRIYVGREFWYVDSVEVEVEENSVGYTIETEILETGPTLDVAGVVSPDRRFVRLEIDVTLYDLIDINTVADLIPQIAIAIPEIAYTQLPIMDLTSISTQVSVPDGGALLIGGLKRKGESKREVGVPLLDKLPYIKRFFTNKSLVSDKHVLVILLRPRIIDLKEEQGLVYPVLGEQ